MRVGIKPIGTNAKIDIKGWETAWEDLIAGEAREVWEYFEQSLSGFHSHNPTITQRYTATINASGNVEVIVGILTPTEDNTIYSYVNWGTRPRVIHAALANRPMVFKAVYWPATARGTLRGGQWAKTGPWQVTWEVHHPGIKARRFDEFIQIAMQGSILYASRRMLLARRGKFWKKNG